MRTKKIIQKIDKRLDSLTDVTINKAKKYDELIEYLGKIKLKVKKSNLFLNEKTANISVNVEYEMKPITIIFDENNEIIKNDRFIAINMLDLISIEDMEKLTEIINEAKRKNM